MAAAFIQAKKNAQRNFKQAITAQEDGVEQYRIDKFRKVTSFRRPLHIDTNLSAENDAHTPECENSATAAGRRSLPPSTHSSIASAWLALRGSDWGDSDSLRSAEAEAGVDFGATRFTGVLKKLVTAASIEWHERQVTITDSAIIFQRVSDDDFSTSEIMDSIPLLEIVQCSKASIDSLPSRSSSMTAIGVQHSSFKDLHQTASTSQSSNAVDHLRTARQKNRSTSMRQAAKLRSSINEKARPVGLVGAGGQRRRHSSMSAAASPRAQWLRQVGGTSSKDSTKDDIHQIATNVPSHFLIEISTYAEGYNSGRIYRLAASTEGEMDEWLMQLQSALSDARTRHEIQSRKSRISRCLSTTKTVYDSNAVQWAVGFLILVNFSVSIWEAETRLVSSDYDATLFDALEISFTVIFCVELFINFIASGVFAFVQDNWNLMDVAIISVSIVAIILKDIPGFSLLRLVRAFRVIRLVRRLSSLRRIVNALASSVVPMCSAFSVLFLVSSIYSVVGVDLFGAKDAAYFGTYSASLFTMFQICTFDDWSDIARDADGNVDFQTALFFVSFVVVVGWVILNVVVAVLLDEFVESVTKDRNSEIEKDLEKEKEKQRSFGSPIDPLLAVLSSFTTSADLSDRIKKVFELLDHEGVGSVDHEDMMYGLRKLSFSPPIHLSFDDFHTMVRDHGGSSVASNAILDEKGRMDIHGFEILISEQLRHYVQRRTAQAMQGAAASGSAIGHVLFVLKLISTNLENVSTTIDRVDSRVDKLEATIAGDAEDADRASNPIQFDCVPSAGAFDRLSSSAEDSSVASPCLPGAASTSANGFAFQGTRIPVDVALHCKMDKLINMMANLTNILTPTRVSTLGSVALGARTDGKLSPVLTVKPASKQDLSSSSSLRMRGGHAAMRQFADNKEPAGGVHSSHTAKSMATSTRAALGSKAISCNESGALDGAAAAPTPVVANGISEKQHLTILHAQCAEASISQQPVSVVESLPRQDQTQQDSGRSHHMGTTHESTLVNPSSDPAHTSIPAWSVDIAKQESPQLASTSQGVKSGPGSALGGSIARRSGRVMSPALESKIQDLMKADEDEPDDGGAVLVDSASGSLKQQKVSQRVKDQSLGGTTPRVPTTRAAGEQGIPPQQQGKERGDEGQARSRHDKTSDPTLQSPATVLSARPSSSRKLRESLKGRGLVLGSDDEDDADS